MPLPKRRLKIRGNEPPKLKAQPIDTSDWPEKWPTPTNDYLYRVHHAWLREVYPHLRGVTDGQKALLYRLVKNCHFFRDMPYDAPPEARLVRLWHPRMSVVDLPSCVFQEEYVALFPEKVRIDDEHVIDEERRLEYDAAQLLKQRDS